MEGVGEATEPERLRARSSWSRPVTVFDGFCEPPNGFRRRLVVLKGGLALPFGAAGGAGESVGLGLPPIRKVIFGEGSAVVDIFSFNLGWVGSGTCFLACASCVLK